MNAICRTFLCAVLFALAMVLAPAVVRAAPAFLVDSTLDAVDDNISDTLCHTAAGTCTLRAAVMQANRYTGSGNVAITLPAGTYTLSVAITGNNGDDSGDLNVTATPAGNSSVSISGAGATTTTIDAAQIDRVFSIANRSVTVSGVTLRNGLPGSGYGGAILNASQFTLTDAVVELSQASQGGGIENDGFMNMTNVVVNDNSSFICGGVFNSSTLAVSKSTIHSNMSNTNGGGIFNIASLTIDQSTISGNSSMVGGGIYNFANSPGITGMTMTNSTISGNHAQGKGGGIATGGTGTVNVALFSSSIIANEAAANPVSGGRGGGLAYGSAGTASLRDSLIAGNYLSGGSSYEDCYDTSVLINAYGLNLFSAAPVDCPFTNPSSVGSTSLLSIGPLQNNGGPTQTHALLAGSNAIGAVASANCTGSDALPVPVDQRGVSRVTDGACDVGAFEYDFGRIFANGFDPP